MCTKKVYTCFFFPLWETMHVFFWMVGVNTFSMHVSSHDFIFSSLRSCIMLYSELQTLIFDT